MLPVRHCSELAGDRTDAVPDASLRRATPDIGRV